MVLRLRFDGEFKYVFQVSESGHHTIEYRFEIKGVYYMLRYISYASIAILTIMLCMSGIVVILSNHKTKKTEKNTVDNNEQ